MTLQLPSLFEATYSELASACSLLDSARSEVRPLIGRTSNVCLRPVEVPVACLRLWPPTSSADGLIAYGELPLSIAPAPGIGRMDYADVDELGV